MPRFTRVTVAPGRPSRYVGDRAVDGALVGLRAGRRRAAREDHATQTTMAEGIRTCFIGLPPSGEWSDRVGRHPADA